jgi:molybdopterin-guanine dinucleotide biosynthesis protein A
VRVVPDRYPGEGPLGGVLTALTEVDHEIVLVVSCDLLAPDASAMAATVAELARPPATPGATGPGAPGPAGVADGADGADVDRWAGPATAGDVAVPEVEGRRQWMHAAWRRNARVREGLAATFAGGERSVHRAVAQARLTVLGVADVAPGAVADADTPDDLGGGT